MSQMICPRCQYPVPIGAFCQRCGASLPRPTYSRRPLPTQGEVNKKLILMLVGGIGALIFFVAISSLIRGNKDGSQIEKTPSTATAPAASSLPQSAEATSVSASVHLAEAKKALADGYKPTGFNRSWGRVKDARKHLESIRASDKEYKEAQTLLKEVERREVEIEKWAKATAEKAMAAERASFAVRLETSYLDKGMDVTVTVSGPGNTIIKLKYVLMSRPMVHKLVNDDGVISTLRSQGFKKAIFTDGYSDTWTYDID